MSGKKTILVDKEPLILLSKFNFVNNCCVENIDLAFAYECSFDIRVNNILTARGIRIIGGDRFNKILQSVILERHGVPHPTTYYNKTTFNTFSYIEEYDSYIDMPGEYVTKPSMGARGICVDIMDRSKYKSIIEGNASVIRKHINESWKPQLDISDGYARGVYEKKDLIVQQLIKIKKEFRVIIFAHGDYCAYERVKSEGQFLGNLSSGASPKQLSIEDCDIINPVIDKMLIIIRELSYPWLSVDVYVDEDGEPGVIEFQMEFAYEGFSPSTIKDHMYKSLLYYMKS